MTKQEILIANGTFNKNYTKVRASYFVNDDFFDPRDIVQVKYEMLRMAQTSSKSIHEVADEFGFSRAGFYKTKSSFDSMGISALVPDKSGPRKARKLTEEHQLFIDEYLDKNPTASSESISRILHEERGLKISKRTVERYRSHKKLHYP